MNADGVILNGFQYKATILGLDGQPLDSRDTHNLIPQVGLTFLRRSPFGDSSPISTFYVGLFSNNYVPTSATTAVDIPTTAGEFVDYVASARPVWNRVDNGTDTYNNAASKASFVFTTDKLIYGAFLVSVSTKGAGTGTLLSMARFETPLNVPNGLTLSVEAGITYIPTA